jgi:molybdenum cofactor cytidylyltransferase
MSSPEAILLAAGQSTRFGSHKLLHKFVLNGHDQPLIFHTLASWLKVFERLTVAVNHQDTALISCLEGFIAAEACDLKLVRVQNAQQGMGVSLASAIAATPHAASWVVGLADMPNVPVSILKAIAEQLNNGGALVAPYYQAQRGHPVGFAASYRDELLKLTADKGARDILSQNAHYLIKINTDDKGVVWDVDTPEDLLVS